LYTGRLVENALVWMVELARENETGV
jgi:hypothetical protein